MIDNFSCKAMMIIFLMNKMLGCSDDALKIWEFGNR